MTKARKENFLLHFF